MPEPKLRKRFNLDLKTLDKFTILGHGGYGVGKTALGGDFLRYEKQFGEVKFFNVKGEDGQLSIANYGLGDVGEHIESGKEFKSMLDEFGAHPVHAAVIDSLHPLAWLVMYDSLGSEKLAVKYEWGEVHFLMEQLMLQVKKVADLVYLTCPSERSGDDIDSAGDRERKVHLYPNLPGKQASFIRGLFDFVGYLEATPTGPNSVKRTIDFRPSSLIGTKSRLPNPITELIEIPENSGGWLKIKSKFEEKLKS